MMNGKLVLHPKTYHDVERTLHIPKSIVRLNDQIDSLGLN
jgi:hypothetical protein